MLGTAVKTLHGNLASHTRVQFQYLLPIPTSCSWPPREETDEGLKSWVAVIHVQDLEWLPSSQLQPGLPSLPQAFGEWSTEKRSPISHYLSFSYIPLLSPCKWNQIIFTSSKENKNYPRAATFAMIYLFLVGTRTEAGLCSTSRLEYALLKQIWHQKKNQPKFFLIRNYVMPCF